MITFIEAKQTNPLEVTIAVSAMSLAIVLVSALWSLRAWKRARGEEEFLKAKIALIKTVSRQIRCKDPDQLQEVETLILGLFAAPNGLHERGEEVLLSIPHLLEARFGANVGNIEPPKS